MNLDQQPVEEFAKTSYTPRSFFDFFTEKYAGWLKATAHRFEKQTNRRILFDDAYQDIQVHVWTLCNNPNCLAADDPEKWVKGSMYRYFATYYRAYSTTTASRQSHVDDEIMFNIIEDCADNSLEEKILARDLFNMLRDYARSLNSSSIVQKERNRAHVLQTLFDPPKSFFVFAEKFDQEQDELAKETGGKEGRLYGNHRGLEYCSTEAFAEYTGLTWRYTKMVLQDLRLEMNL